MPVSDDDHAILALCSHLALPPNADPAPLTLREWNALEQRLSESPRRSPADLVGLTESELQDSLNIDAGQATRIAGLLERSAAIAIELERLESLGIWVVTRANSRFPAKLSERLGESSPIVLFGAGDRAHIDGAGLAVIGSRNIDDAGSECAKAAGEACAVCRLTVFSGGARGTDAVAMHAAIEAGGRAVGILAEGLERIIREPNVREWLANGRLTLLSPYSPKAGFSVGAAMGRNKLIYAVADFALVVSSDAGSGGTWAGAIEALRAAWTPVFVRNGDGVPEGNRQLLNRGGLPFSGPLPCPATELSDWLVEHAAPAPHSKSLFA
jgi:predicted Rossmann fold nucleotide-binding protein DprA/Smf involved in DNA uptake